MAANEKGRGGGSLPAVPTASFIEGGSSAGGEVLGAIGKLRYWGYWEALGALGMTGCMRACQRPWGSQHYPGSRPQGMWGAMICPLGSRVPWAPATGGTLWAEVGSNVGVFCAASLADECLGSCLAFGVNESRKHALVQGWRLQGWQ